MSAPSHNSRDLPKWNRVADVREALMDGPVTVEEISVDSGASPASVYRILAHLRDQGIVKRTPEGWKYAA